MTQALDEPTRLAMRAALEALDERLSTLLTNTESAAQQVPLKENASRLSRMDEMHNQKSLDGYSKGLCPNRRRHLWHLFRMPRTDCAASATRLSRGQLVPGLQSGRRGKLVIRVRL
jgi:hypothetical protein